MGIDGAARLYDNRNRVLFSTETNCRGSFLIINNIGNLIMFDQDENEVWSIRIARGKNFNILLFLICK